MQTIANALNFRELGVFNSREIAIFICGLIVILYCLFNKRARISLLMLVKAMIHKQLTIVYISLILYSLVPISILYDLGFWKMTLVKDSTFWLLFSALPTLFNINKANRTFFINVLKDNLKFSVITDFITSQHTYNIFIEIAIVVISIFIGGILAISGREEKHRDVNRIFIVISYIVGGTILINSIGSFAVNIERFINLDKFEEFSLPLLLGVWFVPFLYVLHLYMVYEGVFNSMNVVISNEKINNFAKKQVVINFKFNTSSLERWKDSILRYELKTKEDVLISFLDTRRLELIERNPPKVQLSDGWSPYESKKFLDKNGIETNHYKKIDDDNWQAISSYVKLNDEIIANNVAYYVLGDSTTAKQLKLVLNINSRIGEDFALDKFVECVDSLLEAALNEKLPKMIRQLIYKRKTKAMMFSSKEISIRKVDHQNMARGYTLIFSIK